MKVDELIDHFPIFFHMAENGSWPSIQEHGLLSTSDLLNLYEYEGDDRAAIESQHRRSSIVINHKTHGQAVIRDQKPMSDSALTRCLQDNLSPKDWYEILNSKVFFWTTEERLLTLLNAGTYKNDPHDVLIIESKRLIENYHHKILLCPMNSGCTTPFAHPRGNDTFLPINDYPLQYWKRKKGSLKKAVVEVVVIGGVPDIQDYVIKVESRRGNEILGEIWSR